MNRTKLFSLLSLGAVALALVVGAVAYRSASAAEPTPTAVPSTTTDLPAGPGEGRGPGRGQDKALVDTASSEELATALGITVDELTAARQKANEAALAQAVEEGLITQAQADEIKANGSTLGGRKGGWFKGQDIDMDALLADALGITVEKLQAAETQVFNARIDQAVTDGTLTQEQADLMKGQRALANDAAFQASMQSAFSDAVNQAAKDGVITQAQADQILADNSALKFFGPHGGPDGFDGGHGGGGRHGGRGGAPSDTTAPAAPSTDTTTP